MITIEEQLAEVQREIGMRYAVYTRRVASGKMTQADADHKIEIMKAVRDTLLAQSIMKEEKCHPNT
jgi:hypothetical protein